MAKTKVENKSPFVSKPVSVVFKEISKQFYHVCGEFITGFHDSHILYFSELVMLNVVTRFGAVPGEVNIERERFKMKLFGNYADSLEL